MELELSFSTTSTSLTGQSVANIHERSYSRCQVRGTVYCEVLDFEVERRLRISWVDRGEENGLNSTVAWPLEPEGNGTHLFLEHEEFDPNPPLQQLGYQMMNPG